MCDQPSGGQCSNSRRTALPGPFPLVTLHDALVTKSQPESADGGAAPVEPRSESSASGSRSHASALYRGSSLPPRHASHRAPGAHTSVSARVASLADTRCMRRHNQAPFPSAHGATPTVTSGFRIPASSTCETVARRLGPCAVTAVAANTDARLDVQGPREGRDE